MDETIRDGLVAYASGDVAQALKAWSTLDPAHPDFDHVRDYLLFVQSSEPDAYRDALGDFEVPGSLAPRGKPLPPPILAPTMESVSGELGNPPAVVHAPPPAVVASAPVA
ncbi:MAG: hypothetical protein AAFY60_12845, partial [Myxococcota bacterium]